MPPNGEAPAPKATEKKVTEFALYEEFPDGTRQGLFSSEDVTEARLVKAQHALAGKRNTVIVQRDCVYPIQAGGRLNHNQSTVAETDLT
jgi:hypothetical protein